jgi:FAD/FMN-containing dehydrogenase
MPSGSCQAPWTWRHKLNESIFRKAVARAKYARLKAERLKQILDQNLSSRDEYDAAEAAALQSEAQADACRIARDAGTPVYPRGAGTSLSGGAIPVRGGIVLSTAAMDALLELDVANQCAVVQPGVIIQRLNDLAAEHGLMYPPDPGSVAVATMGGSIAECAGGLRGLKYGVTKHYVTGLEVVLADGQVVRLGGKSTKNVTGYDLVGLFVGSEGTLGVITEAWVRVQVPPRFRASASAQFDDYFAAVADDLTEEQTEAKVAELRALCTAIAGP